MNNPMQARPEPTQLYHNPSVLYRNHDIQPRLLVVLAHPDDESFGMGGTLAFYASAGVAIHLICATGGEVGSTDPELLQGYQSLAERRVDELRCAAEHLQLASVWMLGYRDSGMPGSPDNSHPQALAAAPSDEVIHHVTLLMRMLRPHVVITFDPIGGYRHPDHIAIQRATTRAFHRAPDPTVELSLPPYAPQKLYFSTFPRRLLRLFVTLMPLFGYDPRRIGRNHDIDFMSIAMEQFPIDATIGTFLVRHQRNAAIQCHASQLGGAHFTRSLIARALEYISEGETFMQAFPPSPLRRHHNNLFEGVVYES